MYSHGKLSKVERTLIVLILLSHITYLGRWANISMILSVSAVRHKMLWEECGYEISEIRILFCEVSFLSFFPFQPDQSVLVLSLTYYDVLPGTLKLPVFIIISD